MKILLFRRRLGGGVRMPDFDTYAGGTCESQKGMKAHMFILVWVRSRYSRTHLPSLQGSPTSLPDHLSNGFLLQDHRYASFGWDEFGSKSRLPIWKENMPSDRAPNVALPDICPLPWRGGWVHFVRMRTMAAGY
jgi:hypothetical protein